MDGVEKMAATGNGIELISPTPPNVAKVEEDFAYKRFKLFRAEFSERLRRPENGMWGSIVASVYKIPGQTTEAARLISEILTYRYYENTADAVNNALKNFIERGKTIFPNVEGSRMARLFHTNKGKNGRELLPIGNLYRTQTAGRRRTRGRRSRGRRTRRHT